MSKYAPQAEEWTKLAYADAWAYLEHRADLVVSLGIRLAMGDEVLDLACGDGGFGEALIGRGLRYRGSRLDTRDGRSGASPAGRGGEPRARRPQRLRASGSCRGHDGLPRDLLRDRPRRVLPPRRRVHGEEARLRPEPAPVPRRRRAGRSPRCGLQPYGAPPLLRPPDRRAPSARSSRWREPSSARARSPASRSATASRTWSPRRASRRAAARTAAGRTR